MPKKLPEMEHPGTFKNSKLFPKNQLQMQHSKLLMFPEHLGRKVAPFLKKTPDASDNQSQHSYIED
jgi:hypothetical protein